MTTATVFCELCGFPSNTTDDCIGCKALEELEPLPVKEDPKRCKCGAYIRHIDEGYVCIRCGRHYGYGYVMDHELMGNSRRAKQQYNIKYHLKNIITRFKLNDEEKSILKEMFVLVLYAYRKCSENRKSMIKLDFVFKKLFGLMKLPDKEAMCKPVKTQSTRKKYDALWRKICGINSWDYQPSWIL